MKQLLQIAITAALLFVSRTLSAQPAIEWQKCLGGSGTEYLYDLAKAADGGYYLAGGTTSYDGDVTGYHGGGVPPHPDAWIVKLGSTSTIEWQKCIGGTDLERPYAIAGTSDGGCLMVGHSSSNDGDLIGNSGSDAWVVRLDAAGGSVAQHFIGGSGGDVGRAIQGTSDGGFALAGSTSSNDGDFSGNHGGVDGWVAKLDADAAVQWQHCYGGSALDELWSVQQTSDGGYVVAGRTYSNDGDVSGYHGSMDAWVLRLDGAGTILWQKCMGGDGDDEFRSAQQTSDGGFILAGSTGSNDGDVIGYHGANDAWVVKLSANGDLQWQKSLGGSQGDGGNAVRQTTDGGFIVTGLTTSNDGDVSGFHQGFGVSDAWVVKLNAAGTLEWQKCLGGTSPESAHAIEETSAQHYVMAGYAWSNDGDVSGNHGGFDGWVVKLGPGEVGVVEEPRTPFTITPNPTPSTLTITPPRSPFVQEIVLMDGTGRMVMTQPTATSTASLTLDLTDQESGLYLVQLRFADGTRAVERVVKE